MLELSVFPDHRTRVAAERRARMHRKLVESALLVFAEKGVDASVIEDVIAAADVSRGTFYNYFRTNGELLAAAIQELGNELVEHIEEAREVDPLAGGAAVHRLAALHGRSATVSAVRAVRRAGRPAGDRARKPGQRLHPGPHRGGGRAGRIRGRARWHLARHRGRRRRDDRFRASPPAPPTTPM